MIAVLLIFVVWVIWLLCRKNGQSEQTELVSETVWTSLDGEEHIVKNYELSDSAADAVAGMEDYEMEHLSMDGATFYYFHTLKETTAPVILFLHGQGGEKEEYLGEFSEYAQMGYSCITLDIAGHGERASEEVLTALEASVQTSADMDLIFEYLQEKIDGIILYGISQGGSIAYHYAAYGSYTPDLLVVASTSPDFVDNYDEAIIVNGKAKEGEENQDSEDFIEKNNPIAAWEQIAQSAVFSGNTIGDTVVSVTGSQELEALFLENGVSDATFLYYSGTSHDLPEVFFIRVAELLEGFYR
ncbi:MAG: alpha/beta hydrolase [Lachnospiraceae bacterium]|nr:alpha/beta hydrolase [Lachnospiraceae bacterium]